MFPSYLFRRIARFQGIWVGVIALLIFSSIYIGGWPAYAESRYWPGGSIYFRGEVTQRMNVRDAMREKVNDAIHIKAAGDHGKWLILRLVMYQYCLDQAQYILNTEWMQMKKPWVYDDYVFLSTKLYESLQPTITKVRAVLDDSNVVFDTVQAHLESSDPDVLYFYSTLAARYEDKLILQHMPTVQQWLHAFFLANNRYPISIEEALESRFVKKDQIAHMDDVIYHAYNVPSVMQISLHAVMPYKIQESRYVMLAPVDHLPHADLRSRDSDSMQLMARTFDQKSRKNLQKNPPTVVGDRGVYWHVVSSFQ